MKLSKISIIIIGIGLAIFGIFYTQEIEQNPQLSTEKDLPEDQELAIQKTWVEMYPIRCFDYTNFSNLNAPIAGCYIDWLESYYGVKQFQPMAIKNYPQTSFQNNSNYIKDHFAELGIIIYDIKYSLGRETLCEFGECWDHYTLSLLVYDSEIDKMIDLGFKVSDTQTP